MGKNVIFTEMQKDTKTQKDAQMLRRLQLTTHVA